MGILAMRNAKYGEVFRHNNLYPDDSLLDFIITLSKGHVTEELAA